MERHLQFPDAGPKAVANHPISISGDALWSEPADAWKKISEG